MPLNAIFIFLISACNCNAIGSIGGAQGFCDDNGKCNCKAHFENDKCDVCTDESEIFPYCDPGELCFLDCCEQSSPLCGDFPLFFNGTYTIL